MKILLVPFILLIMTAMTVKCYIIEKMFEEQRKEHDYKYDSS